MNILDEITYNKRKELDGIKSDKDLFKKVFANKNASIIGEIKLSSPSNKDLAKGKNLDLIMDYYGTNKEIKAISNLIDKKYFSGDINRGPIFKEKYKKPIFFKEFIVDKKQIDGASYFGYDALLLIKRILKNNTLKEFINYTLDKNIYPIVEVDNEKDLKEIIKLSNSLDFGISINSRNLSTMQIDNNSHINFYDKYKQNLDQKITFAFSGINNLKDTKKYKHKYNGVLIGTYFMKNIS